jgi:uncharacterized caspase-like protein
MLHLSIALILALLTAGQSRGEGKLRLAPAAESSSRPSAESRLFVLSIGINDYPGENHLRYATRDARQLVQVLRNKARGAYQSVQTRLLTDQEADREHILEGFTWLKNEVAPHDLAVIYYSGHGSKNPRNGFFLVPFGFRDDRPRATMVSGTELNQAARAVRGSTLVLLDSCFSGAILNEPGGGDTGPTAASSARPGPVYLCASRGNELSDETDRLKHGTFTKALIEALSGKADANHDGVVSLGEVQAYVRKRVRRLSANEQHLVVGGTGLSRSIALSRP